MDTRQRHVSDVETVNRLQGMKNGYTWRGLAEVLGYESTYGSTLQKVASGQAGAMTRTAENMLRQRLGLAPVNVLEVPPCPDCGAAHVGRCYGKPIVQVVVLSEGERVTRAGKARKRKPTKALRLPPDLWQVLNEKRKAAGLTWADYIEDIALKARWWDAPND